jgi:organic radical activating enzyme
MEKKYFPIKTKTACQLKWTWSTISLYNGITKSCHRVDSDTITVDQFDTFHNTPKKLADRNLMLEGQWPTGGCEYCQRIEEAGGSSDRMFHSSIPDLAPPELDNNTTAINVTPRIVEVYFDNVCNMSCVYCWDGFSSQIQQENIKHGRFENNGVVIDNHANKIDNIVELTERFWQWMDKNSTDLRRLHVLGGEPFFQRQFDQCLDFLSTHNNPNLELNIISNLKVPHKRLREYVEKIKLLIDEKRIARFDLTASIDCFGKEQEYVRFGIDLNQWQENFEYLVGQSWITLNINQTLSGLTMKTVPDLLKYINQFRTLREIGHYFSTTVMTHKFLHPGIFGPNYFDDVFEEIYLNMPTETWQQKEAIKYMQGIQAQLNAGQRDQQLIIQLGIFLTEIDRRRNLNWRQVFLWLEREINHVV